ncbi:hypothetical protein KIH41_16260 [Litoribacter ruber]|uniref:DUF6520 family protein n=1 Tax=Litoribacter ruber TaxID=702568 RepID=UPI001BD93428|nr:DUF6520 family protein [Litoribacter ruber]MBT0812841.1 hypothetical protein [Litoribacter ruber]
MKKLIKSLPALGLALAASMAFAFNMPQERQGVLKGQLSNGTWEEIPEGVSYNCTTMSNVCTAEFDENDDIILGTERPGVYSRP